MLSDSDRLTVQQIERHLLSDPEFARMVLPVADRVRGLAAPVVVGVAAWSGPAGRAVEWAAAEAAAQRCPLHVVHTPRLPRGLGLSWMFPGPVDVHEVEVAGARALEAAVARARAVHPDLEITAHLDPGSVAQVLLRRSRDARLLVLGRRADGRSGGGQGRLTGSLAARISSSARCPVAVVRPGGGAPGAARPHVVVGVDGTRRSDAAVGFAFLAAQQRGLGVRAVHAWAADRPADLEAVTAPLITTEAGAHALLHRSLARWRIEHPDVPVVPEVVRRDPSSALLDRAAGAALVVVGTRGRGPARGALLGSVSRAVVDGVPAAVAVVPAGTAGAPTHPGVRR